MLSCPFCNKPYGTEDLLIKHVLASYGCRKLATGQELIAYVNMVACWCGGQYGYGPRGGAVKVGHNLGSSYVKSNNPGWPKKCKQHWRQHLKDKGGLLAHVLECGLGLGGAKP